MDKQQLRREIGTRKRLLTAAQIEDCSARLAQRLFRHPAYRSARALYAYLSYNQEVRTRAILEQACKDGKRVAVPKVYGDRDALPLAGQSGRRGARRIQYS